MADNVLFHGQVLEKEIKGKNAKAIQSFNDMVKADVTGGKNDAYFKRRCLSDPEKIIASDEFKT